MGLLALILSAGACHAQHTADDAKVASCLPLQHRYDTFQSSLKNESALEQRSSLLGFLPDDPENCVTRTAQEALVALERPMFQLKLGPGLISPDWLYQCYAIDKRTQHCSGATPDADDIPHDPDETLMTPHPLPPPGQAIRIEVAPETGCKVETVSVLEVAAPHHLAAPRILPLHAGAISTKSLLHMKSPVLIASIHCSDTLRFRKAAWLLE